MTPQLVEFLMKIDGIVSTGIYGCIVAPSVAVEEDGNLDLWFQFILGHNHKHVGGFGIYIRPAGDIHVEIDGVVMSNDHDPKVFSSIEEKFRLVLAPAGLGYKIDLGSYDETHGDFNA